MWVESWFFYLISNVLSLLLRCFILWIKWICLHLWTNYYPASHGKKVSLEFSNIRILLLVVRLLRLNFTNVVPVTCNVLKMKNKYKVNVIIVLWRTERERARTFFFLIFSFLAMLCSMWDLVLWSEIEPMTPCSWSMES